MQTAIINTEKGNMKVEFYSEDAPNTVDNFVKLSKDGYYDGLTFHKVIPNFVIQGGCPDGTGAGGPGYTIKCELDGGNQYHDKGVYLWPTRAEIQVEVSFLSVIVVKIHSILMAITHALEKLLKVLTSLTPSNKATRLLK